MDFYKVCDSIIGSNVPLPELPGSDGIPEWNFELLPGERIASGWDWFHQWDLPDGRVWLFIGRQGSSYLLNFPDLADFVVNLDTKCVRCYPSPATPSESIRHLLLDQVLPLVLSGSGRLVLHASAVVSPHGAIAFLGRTGYGKSTLAASLSTHGFPLLTDDCLLIGQDGGRLSAAPSYPGLRLWPETVSELFRESRFERAPELPAMAHYSRKKRVGAAQGGFPYCGDPVTLVRVFLLGDPDEDAEFAIPQITTVSPRDAFMQMVQFAFLLDITDPASLTVKFDIFSRAAGLPIFRRVRYAREFSVLPAVRDAIAQDLNSELQ
ncbi:MAG: hypothetical protein M3Z36_13205 [Acidobacteriota bacterium]|nr:hypothetical protein [Acidobacteriota bacterium]